MLQDSTTAVSISGPDFINDAACLIGTANSGIAIAPNAISLIPQLIAVVPAGIAVVPQGKQSAAPCTFCMHRVRQGLATDAKCAKCTYTMFCGVDRDQYPACNPFCVAVWCEEPWSPPDT